MKKLLLLLLLIITVSPLFSLGKDKPVHVIPGKVKPSSEGMLLVLSAPSVHDTYYKSAFDKIIRFHIRYAGAVIEHGAPDQVVILVDTDTYPYYAKKIPKENLLIADVYDIWMRDFTTVSPHTPVQFTYTAASMSEAESRTTQKSFSDFADNYGIKRKKSSLFIDGGNIVDNYTGKAITTTRFLDDNNLSYHEGKEVLKELLNLSEVAILEPDEDTLAHADGMVMWVDDDTLLVNNYAMIDSELRSMVLEELHNSFPTTQIIEVPVSYRENAPGEWTGFESACGANVNSVLTPNNLYVPVFGMTHERDMLGILEKNVSKKIITIDASEVCGMGGSVRCLTWQVTGENAERIVNAAKNKKP